FFGALVFVSGPRVGGDKPPYLASLVAMRNQWNALAKTKSFGKTDFITKTGIRAFKDGRRSLESTPCSIKPLTTVPIASFVFRQCSSNSFDGSQKRSGISFSLAVRCPIIQRVLTTTPGSKSKPS